MSDQHHTDPALDVGGAFDPAAAAEHCADLNQFTIDAMDAEARRLGISEDEQKLAWTIFDELGGEFRRILRRHGVGAPTGGRVALLVSFMQLRGLELADRMATLYGVDVAKINNASKVVLQKRAGKGGQG